jgi:DNA-binding HxlR family transcriptional regulator
MYKLSDMTYDCPIEQLFNILGKKWVAKIIWKIHDNKIRFGELQRSIDGCSKKMLVQQLELLIENNIVINDKKLINNNIESTYYLSESGLTILNVMKKMVDWSNEYSVGNK